MAVIKRNGDIVPFDKNKIIKAVNSAFIEVDGQLYEEDTAKEIANDVESQMAMAGDMTVEDIQDLVEVLLMSSYRGDVAKAYIRYRYKKEIAREVKTDFFDAIGEKLMASNVQNSNANVDEYSFGGRIGEATEIMTKQYALEFLMSKMAKENHEKNMIYTHDLGSYAVGMHNCLSMPLDDLLANGFNTRQADVRPPSTVSTAMQLVAVLFQLQSLNQFGGVSATHLDWTMVPYVRKSFAKHFLDGMEWICDNGVVYDKEILVELPINCDLYKEQPKVYEYAMSMTIRETNQAAEALYHNLGTLQSRSGNQLPFSSINYGTCTLPEGRIVIEALLNASLNGIGKVHKTPIFPCSIFQLKEGLNRHPGDPNYDMFRLALKSTAHRLYPNYANVDWSGNAGYDENRPDTFFSTMGCRTANGLDINGLGQQKDGRGNICPVTIIMPTLAMMAKEIVEEAPPEHNLDIVFMFMELLDMKIHEAKEMLLERFEWICAQAPASAKFMYENNTMAGYIPEEGIRSALRHGTLVIGQLGLAETLQILIGCDHTEPKGMELAKKIEQLFKDRCAQFKEEEQLNFGVYYTPAESLCYTAMKKFKDQYGIIPNVSDKDFFTNSMHVPVWKEISPFDKIDIESQLTGYSSAGCITYVELDTGVKNNIDALETLVNYAMDKDIPYFAINIINDTCLDCGYSDELNGECSECGGHNIQELRRVTGYLTGSYTTAFNPGKVQETEMRRKHSGRQQMPKGDC